MFRCYHSFSPVHGNAFSNKKWLLLLQLFGQIDDCEEEASTAIFACRSVALSGIAFLFIALHESAAAWV